MATKAEKDRLIAKAVREFPSRTGGVNWSAAFKAHPEWEDSCGSTQSLYQRVYQLKKRGQMPSRARRRARNKGIKTGARHPQRNGTHEAQPIRVQLMCPTCGTHLAMPSDGSVVVT